MPHRPFGNSHKSNQENSLHPYTFPTLPTLPNSTYLWLASLAASINRLSAHRLSIYGCMTSFDGSSGAHRPVGHWSSQRRVWPACTQ